MDPKLLKEDGILGFSDEQAEIVAMDIYHSCWLSRDEPDAAFESVTDLEFDQLVFDDFIAEYIANESISTGWGDLINYKKEIKMAGNAMDKAAGNQIKMLPGTDGYTTSAPRKKDGQYYTRATFAFSDGQAVRILFYNPDKPEEKHKYPSDVVSFQVFLNKKDITASLVKGGGKDYGPRQFGKIIGKLIERNSEKFQKKSAEIRAQKEEMEALDKEDSELDKQLSSVSGKLSQSKEKGVFLKKQHADLKEKAKAAAIKKTEDEKIQKAEEAEERKRQKAEEAEKARLEAEAAGPVEVKPSQEELKKLIAEELRQLKADPATPDFKLNLRVGKKKTGEAGKVSVDIKSAEVARVSDVIKLREKIEVIVKAHTDNYSIISGKAEAIIEEAIISGKTGIDVDAVSRVVSAYGDFDGTDEFKASLAGSVNLDDYSEFKSSKVIDVAVKKLGGSVTWSIENNEDGFSVIVGKITVPGGDVSGKTEISSDGKAKFWINGERLKYFEGKDVFGEEVNQWKEYFASEDDNTQESAVGEMIRQLKSEEVQQEQVEETGIKEAVAPLEEADLGELKDRDGVTKQVTHEIDEKLVSATQEAGYIHSAYMRGRKWINLPVEEKTTINEDDLRKAIAKSEEAYQTADDILAGNYDVQGPDKVDQLLDEIAEVIEDDSLLNQVADHYTALLSKKFAPQPATATA